MSTTTATPTLGKAFAEALAAKDFDALGALLHGEIDFRGLTPRRTWEADNPNDVIQGILRQWFEDEDHIEELISVDTDAVADRARRLPPPSAQPGQPLRRRAAGLPRGARRPDRLDAGALLGLPAT